MTEPAPRFRKQEQEPASDEVTEIAPGVLRAQLPIQFTGLGHVNCYVIEDERGAAIVDPGLPGPRNLGVLEQRLRSIGIPLRRVHTVLVTHAHPDHFGGAGWVRRKAGSEVVTHDHFQVFWDPTEPPDVDVEELADPGSADSLHSGRSMRRPWDPPPWGGPAMEWPFKRRFAYKLAQRFPQLARTPRPDRRVHDAQAIRLGRREWQVIHTPGHTDDHICLLDRETGVLLSGDHVLPTITPHIGGWLDDVDPLEAFFASLAKIGSFAADVTTVAPAHGHPFADLTGRVEAIAEHHRERLAIVRRVFADEGRPMTVPEISRHLFSARAQGTMADAETYAHLEHLRRTEGYQRREHHDEFTYVPGG